jgi:aspartate kinase
MKVAKFGGTSLANAQQVRKVCAIVLSDPERRVVVVSAPGKRFKHDIKITDLLIACAEARLAQRSIEGELQAVLDRYSEIARELALPAEIMQGIEADFRARLAAEVCHREHFIDSIKAGGEDNCARLVAAFLRSQGANASYLSPRDAGLLVTAEFGNAQVLPESYAKLAALRDRPGITVFPGFFGYSREGAVVTFSRGGSDITGSILAAAVKAQLYENFTDVDSVFSANPHIIPEAHPIADLTYREMRELSYAGFSVFHEEALDPVYRAGVPVCIKNTNNPAAPGTRIGLQRPYVPGSVVGIAGSPGFCSIYVSKYLMNREIGFGRRLLQILEEEGLSYEHTPSGIDNISVILRDTRFGAATEARVVERIRSELAVDDVAVERDLALIMVVGEGMQHTVGIATRATRAFAQASVNIEMINQGSSEVSMMFGVKAIDNERAIRALYEEFFDSRKG